MQWIKRAEKTFDRHYAPVSANTRSKLCKIQNGKEVLKAFEQTLSKNEDSAMNVNGKKELPLALQTFLAITRSILGKLKSKKEVLKALEAKLNENEVSAMNRKNRKELPYALQTIFSENEGNIMQKSERKRVSRCKIEIL